MIVRERAFGPLTVGPSASQSALRALEVRSTEACTSDMYYKINTLELDKLELIL